MEDDLDFDPRETGDLARDLVGLYGSAFIILVLAVGFIWWLIR